MTRGACALGVVVMVVWLVGGPIAAQEPPAEEPGAGEMPAPPTPAEEPAPTPVPAPAPAAAPAAANEGQRGITLFGELLFLKPTLDDTFFAVVSPGPSTPASSPPQSPPTGKRVDDEFDFEPAFRIGAGYELPESGRELELSYTRLKAEATESVSGNFLWATRGTPEFTFTFGPNTGGYAGSASAEIDARYERIEAHVTQPFELSGLDLGLQFGFEWADFRVGEDYVYVETTGLNSVGRVSAASRSWGIGPEMGLALDYELCEPWEILGTFSVRAGSSIGLLLSETRTRASNERTNPQVSFAVRDDDTSRVLTVVHARIGVGYELPIADRIVGSVGVGYQIDTHLRGLTRVGFPDDVGDSNATTDYQDFDLQGVYASVGVVF